MAYVQYLTSYNTNRSLKEEKAATVAAATTVIQVPTGTDEILFRQSNYRWLVGSAGYLKRQLKQRPG